MQGPGRATPGSAYLLALLVVTYTLSCADRAMISIVQEPLKAEFHWTDWQLGLLGGAAFGLVYSVIGVPVARLAERYNRATIISASAAVWSVMTMLCGFATGFLTIFVARFGVGIGEAGCTPPAHSLISSRFPPEHRATAIGIYTLGMTLGPMTAAFAGGAIVGAFGWRAAFFTFGALGMVLAILMSLTIKDKGHAADDQDLEVPKFAEAVGGLLRNPTFFNAALGAASASFVSLATGQFLASFFIRSHGLSLQTSSAIFGVAQGLIATTGILAGGMLGDRFRQRFDRSPTLVGAAGLLLSIPLLVLAFLAHDLAWALTGLMVGTFFQWFYMSPMYGAVQAAAHPRARATATALVLLIGNVMGYVMGPPVIGALSDAFARHAAAKSGFSMGDCVGAHLAVAHACSAAKAQGLQWAMVVFVIIQVWPATHFILAGRRTDRPVPGDSSPPPMMR